MYSPSIQAGGGYSKPTSFLFKVYGWDRNAFNLDLYYHPLLNYRGIEVRVEVVVGMWPFTNLYSHPSFEVMGLGSMRSRLPCSNGHYLTPISYGREYANR
jgi:hypothetical protein